MEGHTSCLKSLVEVVVEEVVHQGAVEAGLQEEGGP